MGNEGRLGDWMQTYTGKAFWPLDPRPDEVDIIDIAHALANICRFGGHVREFYSVAQHSVHVSQLVPKEYALTALMHDAAEAYIGDMIRPIKHGGAMLNFRNIENGVSEAIALRYGLPIEGDAFGMHIPGVVREADNIALATECRDLMGGERGGKWGVAELPDAKHIWSVAPSTAEHLFLARFEQLTEGAFE